MGASRGWNWHAWLKKDGIRKYMGFFESEDSALLFKRRHADKEFISITNYGPLDLAAQGHQPKVVHKATGGGAIIKETREQMQAREAKRREREAAQEAARAEAIRKDRERQAVTREQREKDIKRREQDAKDMAGIRKDAAEGLEKHKADEAADLKAGINR